MGALPKFVLATMILGVWASGSSAADRSPTQILGELDGIKVPAFDANRKGDPTYSRGFLIDLRKSTEARAALILELFRLDPDHDRIPTLLAERWSVRQYGLSAEQVLAEIDEALARTRDPRLKAEGVFARAYTRLYESRPDRPVDPSIVEDFVKLAPKDPRGATLLQMAARRTSDAKARAAFEARIVGDYPESLAARKLEGLRFAAEGVGKPFRLEFRDAIGGADVSVEKLRGKVVVIDFWATWCVPCVDEMPAMKERYARYRGRGVEFLGVSLDKPEDQGGLARLKEYVERNAIPWPQYYQGEGWESRFSVSCGIHAIPAIFVVDAEGILRSTDADGKLDAILDALLAKSRP